MLVDNPGDQEGGGLYQPSLDYTGKHTGRPSAIGSIGPGPLEGTHIHSLTHSCLHAISVQLGGNHGRMLTTLCYQLGFFSRRRKDKEEPVADGKAAEEL